MERKEKCYFIYINTLINPIKLHTALIIENLGLRAYSRCYVNPKIAITHLPSLKDLISELNRTESVANFLSFDCLPEVCLICFRRSTGRQFISVWNHIFVNFEARSGSLHTKNVISRCLFVIFDLNSDKKLAVLIFSLLGKSFITLAYTVVYLYGSEIFPTEVRIAALGVASTMEGLGAVLAPIVAGPMVIFLIFLSVTHTFHWR